MAKKSKPKLEKCPNCGGEYDPLIEQVVQCPGCHKEGATNCCCPGGKNCLCPECEENGVQA